MGPLQDPRLRIHISISLYLRLLCKIHVSRSVYKHPYVSQDPLQDLYLQYFCISGTSARSMSPDPYINIYMYLRILCKIYISDSYCNILLIRFCVPAQTKRKFWLPETRFAWPCAGKTIRSRSAGVFRAGETQLVTSGDALCVALRRENSPTECFAQAKRKFWIAEMLFLWPCAGETQIWPPETRLVSISRGFTRSHDRMNENRHGASARRKKRFRATVSRRRNANFDLRSGVFCGPAQWNTRGTKMCT